MIRATGITVRRSGRNLVDGADIAAAAGELTVIVGPNGAGKSTLLRVLGGDIAADAGETVLLDRPLRHWRRGEIARWRAVLPQGSALNFAFRVRDVVRLGRLPFPPSPEDGAIAARALSTVGLHGFGERLYPNLSGGEQRRVQLARVLAQADDALRAGRGVLLLDEPTANLDPAHGLAALREARRMARAGLTVLAVVHDVNLAAPFADRFIGMREGRVAFSGPPHEALTPENLRTVYGVETAVLRHPGMDCPLVAFLPGAAERA
ncbi:heme ABC transporter ATP-binding protein [Oleispirillum naphthae]|uniref:heme ABC transporter ATP-binding protein n=1 Tax=Oleispirillum naphthae TaxID=2838853 RepID=UPI0030824573